MNVGKLSNEELSRVIFDEIKEIRSDILVRPGVGEDCGVVKIEDMACVLTTDPITGATEELGKLAVHVSLNDVASSGAEPVAILLTLLCPENTEPKEIQRIISDANREANALNVEIIGGHTEITSAVNRIIVSVTAFGKTPVEKLIRTKGAHAEDYLYLTKHVALEGTAIIAREKEEDLREVLGRSEIQEAMEMFNKISVLKEGQIGSTVGVSAMHDVTEGGVLGAIYELCECNELGCKVYNHQFNVKEVTQKICDYYTLNPLKLISSGSMLMSVPRDKAPEFEQQMLQAEIEYAKIGFLTEVQDKLLVYGEEADQEIADPIEPPMSDELYKVVG